MSDTALIVIDAQESFRHRSYFREDDLARYVERQQALIDGATAAGLPVVQIFHFEDEGQAVHREHAAGQALPFWPFAGRER